jgi:hypothetical protein
MWQDQRRSEAIVLSVLMAAAAGSGRARSPLRRRSLTICVPFFTEGERKSHRRCRASAPRGGRTAPTREIGVRHDARLRVLEVEPAELLRLPARKRGRSG